MRIIARFVLTGFGLAAALGSASAQSRSLPPGLSVATPAALEVPYLAQSELLCGGAALAMLERWWGRRGVYAEDFEGLVHRNLGGIRTADLAAAAQSRGWNTSVFNGTARQVQQWLGQGVPVVALIQVAPHRYHYVVVLQWGNGRVVFHDPAVAPSARMEESRFLSAWTGADRWSLAIRPASAAFSPPPAAQESTPAAPLPCAPWLDRAIDAAALGRLNDASRGLDDARVHCPTEVLILREMAGVRFRQKLYAEAESLARDYLSREPGDSLGWQLLAASRFVSGDAAGALAAWNRVGRPTVDLLRVEGLRRIRFGAIADAVGIPHGNVLTPSQLVMARRRVAELPAVSGAAVDYTPLPEGEVEVRAAIAERPTVERPIALLGVGAVRALSQSEVRLEIASITGAGELWTGIVSWRRSQPRVGVRLDIPIRIGIPEILGVEGGWNRYRFGIIEVERRLARVTLGGWVTASVRPTVALGLERWSGGRDYWTASAGTELHAAGERLTLTVSGQIGRALSTQPSYAQAGIAASWISAPGLGKAAGSIRVGTEWVSAPTPVGAWPGAGGDLSWDLPLRAHFAGGGATLSGAGSGRSIVHGGVAGDVPVYRLGPVAFAVGSFLDAAAIRSPADGSADRTYLDAGAGLRIGIGNGRLGVLRVDWAHGVLDHTSALTIGIHQHWPSLRP